MYYTQESFFSEFHRSKLEVHIIYDCTLYTNNYNNDPVGKKKKENYWTLLLPRWWMYCIAMYFCVHFTSVLFRKNIKYWYQFPSLRGEQCDIGSDLWVRRGKKFIQALKLLCIKRIGMTHKLCFTVRGSFYPKTRHTCIKFVPCLDPQNKK